MTHSNSSIWVCTYFNLFPGAQFPQGDEEGVCTYFNLFPGAQFPQGDEEGQVALLPSNGIAL